MGRSSKITREMERDFWKEVLVELRKLQRNFKLNVARKMVRDYKKKCMRRCGEMIYHDSPKNIALAVLNNAENKKT